MTEQPVPDRTEPAVGGQPDGWASPLLSRPGAVAAVGHDTGVAAHYGDPFREQRALAAGSAVVDTSHLGVVRLTGPDRRRLLHSLSTQDFTGVVDGGSVELAILSPHGHVEHHAHAGDDGTHVHLVTDAGRAAALAEFLDRMVFSLDVEVADVTDRLAAVYREQPADGGAAGAVGDRVALAVVATPRGRFELVDRAGLADGPAGERLAGIEAYEALRIAAGEARQDLDVDHRTIPNELGWIGTTVALDKGCYRGQETVARVHTLGRPPRRLTVLWVDGSDNVLPAHGDEVLHGGRVVGTVGSAARHFEAGPIALALVKRSVPVEATLVVRSTTDLPATQESVFDPDIGLHVRARLG